jgi:hypothetical protein
MTPGELTPTRAHVAQAIDSVLRYVAAKPFVFEWQEAYEFAMRANRAAMRVIDETEAQWQETSRGLAAYAVVTAYLQETRTGLSVTEGSGFCVLEQDGTRLHCATTILDLADWCRAQNAKTTKAPTGGFKDYMAREWIT